MTAFSNPASMRTAGPLPRFDAAFLAWNTVASYSDYADAQRAVDHLSDHGFPVEHLDIVGSDLRLVERVVGRLTTGKAAAAGAVSGAWFGLFMGLLFGIFADHWLGAVLFGVFVGAAWGGVFGFFGHAATRGQRDFASTRTMVALRYDLVARDGQADAARAALDEAGLRPAQTPPAPTV